MSYMSGNLRGGGRRQVACHCPSSARAWRECCLLKQREEESARLKAERKQARAMQDARIAHILAQPLPLADSMPPTAVDTDAHVGGEEWGGADGSVGTHTPSRGAGSDTYPPG